ncbi:multipolar spindle 1 [Raphanus sativus]|nr:multipolar spindle 1 [Raphanus sativus]
MGSSLAEANQMEKEESLKLAIAVSLLRSKIQKRRSSSSTLRCNSSSKTDALRWKHKAKERKKEIIRLQEDLKDAESGSHCDLFPANASCKCYFFDNLGEFSGRRFGEEASEPRFNLVLRRRFLRLGPVYEEEAEHLKISIDFLLELAEADSNASYFSNWSHQAVDSILASLRKLISIGRNLESVEESISFMITQLINRMCTPFKGNETSIGFYAQHLIRKLGSDSRIGQRAIFAISQRISVLAENLLVMDPFDESLPEIDECVFILIQLIEFLICDYLLPWAETESFETVLLEEWIASVVHARKAVAALEERNGLYILYMDRPTQNDYLPGHEAGQTRKLGVFIRKRGGGGYRRSRTTTSASVTLLSGSFHMTACFASSFLLSLLF